jgi:signal transduction histidine kinase
MGGMAVRTGRWAERAAGWAALPWHSWPRRGLGLLLRAEPRRAAPSGWALALDAAIAVGAAVGAVYEVATHGTVQVNFNMGNIVLIGPGGLIISRPGLYPVPVPVHTSVLAFAAAALTGLPLAVRRLYPITAWLVIAAAIVVVHPTVVPPVALGTAVFAAYSAVVHSRYRNLAIASVALVTIAVTGALGNQLPRFPGRLTALFAIFPAAVAGIGIRSLRLRLADSAARLRRAAAEAEAETRRALAAERSRIASELHDVVTHNVAVMLIQAGAARKILADSPADAEDALLAVEATGRDAMAELRNLLGLLNPADDAGTATLDPAGSGTRAGNEAASATGGATRGAANGATAAGGPGAGGNAAALRPQPGLGELAALVSRVRGAGLPVELQVAGEPRPLPPGVDLAAFRAVHEGLTNVLRHAGPASATVAVEWGDNLVITVTDDGRGSAPPGEAESGRGLLGLRERLALYGGELDAGPQPAGGWRLRAALPVTGGARA